MKENLDVQLENIRERLDHFENIIVPDLKEELIKKQLEIDELRGLIKNHIGHP